MPSAFDPRVLAKLKGLSLRARHIVEGYVAGLHRSPYRGFSIEFAEHREYAPGDDLRYVDWKVFGRTDKFYLKQFEDETNLVAYLILDISESMTYRGPDVALSKLEYGQCLAAALAWLVLHQQDAVGLATFDEQVRSLLRPSGNPMHWQQVLEVLDTTTSTRKTDTEAVFRELAARFTKRSVVLIFSDLLGNVEATLRGLKHFHYRHHDVVLFHLLDPAEIDFPFHGPRRFQGLEQWPEQLADPEAIRRGYLEEFARYQRDLQAGSRGLGMDYQLLRTDRPFDTALSSYLASRSRRVKS